MTKQILGEAHWFSFHTTKVVHRGWSVQLFTEMPTLAISLLVTHYTDLWPDQTGPCGSPLPPCRYPFGWVFFPKAGLINIHLHRSPWHSFSMPFYLCCALWQFSLFCPLLARVSWNVNLYHAIPPSWYAPLFLFHPQQLSCSGESEKGTASSGRGQLHAPSVACKGSMDKHIVDREREGRRERYFKCFAKFCGKQKTNQMYLE